MDGMQQRGRSPSAGHRAHIRQTPSPSPHAPFHNNVSGLDFDQSPLLNDPSSFAASNAQLNPAQYLATLQPQSFPHQQQQALADQTFLHSNPALSQHNTPHFGPQGNSLTPDHLDITNPGPADFNSFFSQADLNQPQAINPAAFGNTLDPHLLDASQPQQQPQQQQNLSINPSDLMAQMATTQSHAPTPPHLLPNMNSQRSPSPHASPHQNQGAFSPPNHSRHASLGQSSLDPSAAYGQGTEWANMANFRGHRRTPSESAYSDMSSAHASPFLVTHDSFEETQHSPNLNAQTDPQLFQNPISQFDQFNLNDGSHISPGHSPAISPRLIPQQQSLPQFMPGSFGLESNMNNHFVQQQNMGVYQNQGVEPFPSLNEFGQADTMSPPEINIDFAPPSRQASFEPPKPGSTADALTDTLSPPDRSRSRNRTRAKSDPFSSVSSRASTPGSEVHRSLSPSAAKSRSPSPSGKSSRRSSTSSVPNRDYILELADPSRPANPADGSNLKRTQKHPATFQCTLCPKRFTRAYNLRSHLRTHTDERPFVCSVCGKAFARQHDRKRHEGLHSGEKKFVCRGNLKDNGHWGCGRRFARADALGRHFRSEAGRVCIRPLLEEEAQEKGGWDGQQQQQASNGNGMFNPVPQNFGGMMQTQPGYEAFPQLTQAPQSFLPAALLVQYPALATMDWNSMPVGGPDEADEISGRSSFDASSGGEYFEDESDYQQGQQPVYSGNNSGWVSDSYDGRN
ncbi:DNA-binding transcription factor [Ascochyta clinopodiicola]|nr:DNA-binding transcription factor [Ascochyta clinopodiicola]